MESPTQLTSKNNPILKKIRSLAAGSQKGAEVLVVAEGTRVLEEVRNAGHPIESVVLSDRFGSNARERGLYANWRQRGIRLYQVQENLFRSVSCLQTNQGAIALVHVPAVLLPRRKQQNPLILYACEIQDPGNLGTLIRTAAASGATLFCTSIGTVSARNPKVIRASAGIFFRQLPVEHLPGETFLKYCSQYSIQAYRTDIRQGIPYSDAPLASPCAILLGNEAQGMKKSIFAHLPAIRIPMDHRVESLNVASAGAVILFEAARQRSH